MNPYIVEKPARFEMRLSSGARVELDKIASEASKVRGPDCYYGCGVTRTDIVLFALHRTFPRGALKNLNVLLGDAWTTRYKIAQIEKLLAGEPVKKKAAAKKVKKKAAAKKAKKKVSKVAKVAKVSKKTERQGEMRRRASVRTVPPAASSVQKPRAGSRAGPR